MFREHLCSESVPIFVSFQVLQSDMDALKTELLAKDHAIRRLESDNERLKRQKSEQSETLQKLKESSTALREDMESMLSRHREELEAMERGQQSMTKENDALRSEIGKLKDRRTELLSQIKMLSDVSEEWEERFNRLQVCVGAMMTGC